MNWVVLALLSVLLFSVSSLLQRVLMKDEQSNAHAYSIVFQILLGVIVGLVAVLKGFVMPPIAQFPINFLLVAVLYGLGTLFVFNAFKYIEASEVTIITSTRTIVTIISAIFLLGEVFDLKKALGTLLILFSAYLISRNKKKFKVNKGVLYALGMAACYGLAITNDTFLLKHVEVFSFLTVSSLLPGFFLIAVKPKALLELGQFLKPKVLAKMLILTVFYAGGAALFYFAIIIGAKASQITPISQSSVIVTVILAAIFLNERDYLLKKIFSAVLVTIGVLLIK